MPNELFNSQIITSNLTPVKMTAFGRWKSYSLVWTVTTICVINAAGEDRLVCNAPLGMESGLIPDSALSASSSYARSVGPEYGRIRVEKGGGAWCPRPAIQHNVKEWLEVALNNEYRIMAVETQGRFGNGQGQEFAENFLLEYWRESLNRWIRYKDSRNDDVLKGNWNPWLAQTHTLELPFVAQKVRFIPYSQHPRTACMRVELYGCLYTDGVRSYSVSTGTGNGTGNSALQLVRDVAYDGVMVTSHAYQGGLGHLVDGRLRPPHGLAHAQEENRANDASRLHMANLVTQEPALVVFEFVKPTVFTAATLFLAPSETSLLPSVLQVIIELSLDGEKYYPNSVHYQNGNGSLNWTVPLRHRIGKFVRFQFRCSESPLRLTEVTFSTNSVALNESSYLSMQRLLVVEETTLSTVSSTGDGPEVADWTQPIAGAVAAVLLVSVMIVSIVVINRRRRSAHFPKTSPSSNVSSIAMCDTLDTNRSGRSLKSSELRHNVSQSRIHELGLPESESESSSFLYHEPYPGCQIEPHQDDSDLEYGALIPRNSPRCHVIANVRQLPSGIVEPEVPAIVFTLSSHSLAKQPHICRDRGRHKTENHYAATDILNISGELAMEVQRPVGSNMVQLTAF